MGQISEIFPIFFAMVFFAFFSHTLSQYDDIRNRYVYKEKLIYCIMIFALIIFAGLREAYNDTAIYIWQYEEESRTIEEGLFNRINWSDIGSNPGFWFTMGIMKTMGISTNSFLLIFSMVTLLIYGWFVHKHTHNIMFSSFLMFIMCYTFTMAAVKQCFAMALCLIATEMCLRRKRVFFVLFIVIAILFHPYAAMFFICPFLMFKPWTRKTWILLGIFAFVGVSLQFLVGRILDVTTMIGETYDSDSFTGAGVNPFRVLVHLTPIFLSYLVRKNIPKEECSDADCLCLNLSMLNGSLMFVGLFGTANYFGRLANYFSVFPIVTIPWLFKFIDKRYRAIIAVAAVVAYILFFYFESTISGMNPFNQEFRRITLWQYLSRVNSGAASV